MTAAAESNILRSMFIRGFALVASLLSVANSLSGAGSWPEFRGPSAQGDAAGLRLPVSWNATSNVVWKQTIPGEGWSSPVLDAGKIYLTTAVESGAGTNALSLYALCLDADSGKTLWKTGVFSRPVGSAPRGHNKNSQASPTPLIAAGRLYAHFGHLGTACLDLDGKVIWRNEALRYPPVHGNGGSPVLVDDALIFSCDGGSEPFLAALHKDTGTLLWKTPRQTSAKKTFSFSTPLVIEINGAKQVISPGSGFVGSYHPKTGKEIWRVRYGEGYSVVPRPVFGHGLLFVSSGFDRPVVYAIRPDGHGDVTDTHVAWTIAKSAPNTPSMLLVGEELYFVSDAGVASCVDARTGIVHWQERVGGNHSASPIHAQGRIYFQNEEGVGVVVQAGKTFHKLASNDIGERTLATYAAGDNALFIRSEHDLYKIEAR